MIPAQWKTASHITWKQPSQLVFYFDLAFLYQLFSYNFLNCFFDVLD